MATETLSRERVLEIIEECGGDKEHLLSILIEIQRECRRNYINEASARVVAEKLDIPLVQLYDILTFYDIDGNLLGTFSHSAKSDLIGFNSTRVIYKDEEGQEIETNYGRVDVTLHLSDGTGKYSTMTQTREDSYYLRYNMGSTTGEAFSNRITCSKGSDDVIDLDIELPNVVFLPEVEVRTDGY